MTGTALVLSLIGTTASQRHLVPVETVPLHQRSGRCPALWGVEIAARAERGDGHLQREPARSRRLLLAWAPRTRRHSDRHA